MGYSIDISTQPSVTQVTADKQATTPPAASGSSISPSGLGNQEVKNLAGGVVTGGTQDGISVSYDSGTGTASFTNTDKGSVAVAAHEGTNNIHQIADVVGLQDELDLAPFESTGSVQGLALSVFSTTQIAIAAGTAIFVDFTNPAAPVQSKLTYAGANVTITGIGSQLLTYLALTSTGTVLQQSTPFTAIQRRTVVPLGAAVHTDLTSLQAAVTTVASVHGTGNQLHDLLQAIGALNIDGNVYSANGANLSLNRSAGSIFKFGANSNYDDPHNLSIAGMTAGSLFYHTSTGVIAGPTTTVNVTQFESAPGVLSTVSNNKFTIQRIYLFQTGQTRLQYGTVEYPTIDDAIAALESEPVTLPTAVKTDGILRGFLIVEKAATALNNPAQARFFEAGKFGGSNSGGSAVTSASIIAALGYTPETTAALPAHVAAADPHTQYVKVSSLSELVDDRVAALLVAGSNITLTYDDTLNTLTIASTGGGVTDHGALTGLGDDDHTQYYNAARGDARYGQLSTANTWAGLPTFTAHIHNTHANPYIQWNETDQVLPAGRWRIGLSNDSMSMRRNTAVAGDFSSESTSWTVSSAAMTINVPILMGNGSSSAPSHSFSSDTTLGMYRIADGNLGFRAGTSTELINFAGSGTGVSNIYVGGSASNNYAQILGGGSSTGMFNVVSVTGAATMDIAPRPVDGTGASTLRFNRQTDTSGLVQVQMFRGDGTSTVDHNFASGSSGVLAQLCRNGGRTLVGGPSDDGTSALQVNGNVDAGTFNNQVLDSGTYTPTLTAIANVSASTANANATYTRVGDIVTVSMFVAVDPTTANTNTQLEISLPIASNLSSFSQLSGTANRLGTTGVAYLGGIIIGVPASDNARLDFLCDADVANRNWTLQFQYRVV